LSYGFGEEATSASSLTFRIVSEALLKEYYLYYEHRSVSMIVSTYFHSFSTGSPKFNRTSFGGRNR